MVQTWPSSKIDSPCVLHGAECCFWDASKRRCGASSPPWKPRSGCKAAQWHLQVKEPPTSTERACPLPESAMLLCYKPLLLQPRVVKPNTSSKQGHSCFSRVQCHNKFHTHLEGKEETVRWLQEAISSLDATKFYTLDF